MVLRPHMPSLKCRRYHDRVCAHTQVNKSRKTMLKKCQDVISSSFVILWLKVYSANVAESDDLHILTCRVPKTNYKCIGCESKHLFFKFFLGGRSLLQSTGIVWFLVSSQQEMYVRVPKRPPVVDLLLR